jgi:hypothetical protein
MSTDVSEYCRIENETQDLVTTIRVVFRGLVVTKSWPLFRRLFAEHPNLKAEHFFGAIWFLFCNRWPDPDAWANIDSDTACEILEEKLRRMIEFVRVVGNIPQDKVGAAWTIYEGSGLPDQFFTNASFLTTLDTFAALGDGAKPRNIN